MVVFRNNKRGNQLEIAIPDERFYITKWESYAHLHIAKYDAGVSGVQMSITETLATTLIPMSFYLHKLFSNMLWVTNLERRRRISPSQREDDVATGRVGFPSSPRQRNPATPSDRTARQRLRRKHSSPWQRNLATPLPLSLLSATSPGASSPPRRRRQSCAFSPNTWI